MLKPGIAALAIGLIVTLAALIEAGWVGQGSRAEAAAVVRLDHCNEGGDGFEGQSLWQLDLGPKPHSKRLIRRDGRRGWTILDVSPDGSLIAYAAHPGLGIATVRGERARTVAAAPGALVEAHWSPNGRRLAFGSTEGDRLPVFVVNRDGSGLRRITEHGYGIDWSPDSRRLAFMSRSAEGTKLTVARADGSLLQIAPATFGTAPVWSPRGDWIAYESRVYGHLHLIRPDGSGDRRLQVLGVNPSWSRDGRSFVFIRRYDDPIPPNADALGIADLRGRLIRSFQPGEVDRPEWSPAAGDIVYSHWEGNPLLETTSQLFAIRADGTGRRKLTNDPELDDGDGDTENVTRVMWVRQGLWKGRRIFYLRKVCE